MKKLSLLLCFCFSFAASCCAQSVKKIVVDESDAVSGYYLALEPAAKPLAGVLVLLPGYGGGAESVFPETKLPNVAYANNLLVVAVAAGTKLYADSTVTPKLGRIFRDVIERYDVKPEQFVLGGFSAGGTIALRYTELCHATPAAFPIQPKGVFMVDSPIDLFELYDYFGREIAKDFSPAGMSEARFATKIMTDEHGTPSSNPAGYELLSPFHADLKTPGNERHLKDVAVRTYHDIDITWILTERRRSAFDANFLASSELINRLLLMGNERAEFIQSNRKGYRSDGTRHPHSWSIVDEIDCVQWVLGVL